MERRVQAEAKLTDQKQYLRGIKGLMIRYQQLEEQLKSKEETIDLVKSKYLQEKLKYFVQTVQKIGLERAIKRTEKLHQNDKPVQSTFSQKNKEGLNHVTDNEQEIIFSEACGML